MSPSRPQAEEPPFLSASLSSLTEMVSLTVSGLMLVSRFPNTNSTGGELSASLTTASRGLDPRVGNGHPENAMGRVKRGSAEALWSEGESTLASGIWKSPESLKEEHAGGGRKGLSMEHKRSGGCSVRLPHQQEGSEESHGRSLGVTQTAGLRTGSPGATGALSADRR